MSFLEDTTGYRNQPHGFPQLNKDAVVDIAQGGTNAKTAIDAVTSLVFTASATKISEVCNELHNKYGEMYIYNNSTATVIDTANTPIALRQITTGLVSGFTFVAGHYYAMDSFADYSGTVAGTVRLDDMFTHGFYTGNIITISGTTNYNGIFKVTVIDASSFYITATWAGDDGASECYRGASLTALSDSAGVYTSTWQMTTAPAGACELCFKVNINETPQNKLNHLAKKPTSN